MSSDSLECGQPEYSLEKVSAKRPGEQTLVGLTGCLTPCQRSPEGVAHQSPVLGGWRARCWLVMLVHPALWPIPSRHCDTILSQGDRRKQSFGECAFVLS